MERRSALKNMGMVIGYTVAAPTLLSIVQSCKEKAAYASWAPSYFEKDQGYAIAQIVDIILPKTDTPSATEVNVHIFIDEFMKAALPEEQKQFLSICMDSFFGNILEKAGKENLTDLDDEDIEPVLAKYLKKRSDEEEEAHNKIIGEYMEAVMKGEQANLDTEVASYTFADGLRGIATWAYKSSEYVGEEVLAYLPIPGEYVACADVNELTQGRDWSLK